MRLKYLHAFFLAFGWLTAMGLLLAVGVMVAYQLAYEKVILPRSLIAGIEVSNLTKEEAKKRLVVAFENKPNLVVITHQGEVIADTKTLAKKYDFDWAAEAAFTLGRSGNPLTKIKERVRMFSSPTEIRLPTEVNDDEILGIARRVAEKLNRERVMAKIVIDTVGGTKVAPGVDGLVVDEKSLALEIKKAIAYPGERKLEAKTEVESAAVDSGRIDEALATAEKWRGRKLRLYYGDFEYVMKTTEVFELIGLAGEPVDRSGIAAIMEEVKPQVETGARNAVFNFEEGKVVEFSPEVNGVAVDGEKFVAKLSEAVLEGIADTEIPVKITEAKVKAGDINSLGIKTLVGVGTSKFAHSIPNRVHNLTLASSRLNGALIAPGETFSLEQTIGEISSATGYKPAYVISEGRTVLGDGGGVCQVSTTLFRAVLNAGLPIVERKAHAYRVGYYEQDMGPGYDATVFFPSTDFRFINDTPGYLLIQTKVDAKNFSMRYEIYGTDDGRKASISEARITNQTPPKATVYQDDPTLPIGKKVQVDWSASGAKVSFDYKVTRNGEVLQDRTFFSNYQPWAAVYLVGTGELASQ